MHIGAVGSVYEYACQKTSRTTTERAGFSNELKSGSNMDPLDYYKALCSEFSDITFRLDDKATSAEKGDEPWMGYNNSMNQIGKGFGNKGQCSISIDISVIEKMQKDPKYEEQVRGLIEDTRSRYSGFEADAALDNKPYISVMIEDNHGTPQRGVVQSGYPYSTEKEIQQKWSRSGAFNILKRFESDRRFMLDEFMRKFDNQNRRK